MITNETIEQMANDSNPFTDEKSDPKIAYRIGFRSGAKFAKVVLESITFGFVEWCALMGYKFNPSLRVWKKTIKMDMIGYTTPELYDKFKTEIGQADMDKDEFIKYCKNARIEFVVKFWEYHQYDPKERVIAEDFLIAFDQLLERYTLNQLNLQKRKP